MIGKTKMPKNILFDLMIFGSIILILICSNSILSSGIITIHHEKNQLLGYDSDINSKEMFRSFSMLADDVCDDCDDDDDPEVNKKPMAFIYSIQPNPADEYEKIYFEGYGEDTDGTIIGYLWESSIDGVINQQSFFNYSILTPGKHTIYFSVEDNLNRWSDSVNISLEIFDNQPPSIPIIAGSYQGKINEESPFEFITTDPEKHDLYYFIEWGDGSEGEWIGTYQSDEAITLLYIWEENGEYIIRAKAKDIYGSESEWGYLEIQMSKKTFFHRLFFSDILRTFLGIFPIFESMV